MQFGVPGLGSSQGSVFDSLLRASWSLACPEATRGFTNSYASAVLYCYHEREEVEEGTEVELQLWFRGPTLT